MVKKTPNPIYYFSKEKNKEYIIFAPDSTDCNYCLKYNINDNKFEKLAKYPKTLHVQNHQHFINTQNEKYYIYSNDQIAEFDLNENAWKIIPQNTSESVLIRKIKYVQYIPSPLDEIHLFEGQNHFKMVINSETYDLIDQGSKNLDMDQSAFHFSSSLNELFIMTSTSHEFNDSEIYTI